MGFRCRDKYRIEEGKPVFVLCNHQTDEDPFCVLPAFDRPVYPVATDNIFAGRFLGKFFSYLSLIPKKKGASDVGTILKINEYLKKGASVLLFPEGNRFYAEFRYYIAPGIVKLLRNAKATLVLFNLHGGSGVSPRFKNKKRRGPFRGSIDKILTYGDYSSMSDDELFRLICDSIYVFDSDSGERYKSRKRAEYLERMLFCCPGCGSFETLSSKGKYLTCSRCGLTAEYGEDLRMHGVEGYERLADWWEFQKKAVRDMPVEPGKRIFGDRGVKLFRSLPFTRRKKLGKGDLVLTDKTMSCAGTEFDVSGITSASVISGRKLTFVYDRNDYTLRGGKRFDPVKYIFALNRLDTAMRRNKTDKYFNLG